MKKIQSFNSMLLKTLEASEMRAVNGGFASEPSKTFTEARITIYGNGNPSKADAGAQPNDGCDDNCQH